MSSRFNPSNTPRLRPPWCKAGLFPVAPPLVDGYPSYLVAYLQWRDLPTPDPFDQTTAIRLAQAHPFFLYEGVSALARHHLGAKVTIDFDSDTAIMEIQTWKAGVLEETFDWPNVPLGNLPHYDSHLQEDINIPQLDYRHMQVWS